MPNTSYHCFCWMETARASVEMSTKTREKGTGQERCCRVWDVVGRGGSEGGRRVEEGRGEFGRGGEGEGKGDEREEEGEREGRRGGGERREGKRESIGDRRGGRAQRAVPHTPHTHAHINVEIIRVVKTVLLAPSLHAQPLAEAPERPREVRPAVCSVRIVVSQPSIPTRRMQRRALTPRALASGARETAQA
eukprot:682017-Rhodomonas_salina.1